MIIGITFEEKILKEITLKKYIEIMKVSHVTQLELAPNFLDYDFNFYKKIYDEIVVNDFKFNFHLPSFVNEKLSVDNFCESNKKYFNNYFSQLDQIFNLKEHSATIVFHGAKYEEQTQLDAIQKTVSFIQFALDFFSKNNYNLTLSIETLNKNKYKIVGDSRSDLIQILNLIDSPKLKICWDITHDFLNYDKILYPEGLFLDAISHCHLHGFKDTQTHLSFSDNFKLFPAVKFAKKNNIPINIELLMQDHYLDFLKKDLSTIQLID